MFDKEINRADLVKSLIALGHEITFLVEGHIGSSKSSLIHDLSKALPTHRPVYFDMTQIADAGDFQIPAVDHNTKTSAFYPNESFGLHTDQPMIIMFDELGKASQQVRNAVLPALNERRWGNRVFHKDTIVFATTNLGAEAVGDLMKPHERNRITKVRMKKPSADEFIQYGASHGLNPIVAAWVHETPQCFASFDDVTDPESNPYIYHPRQQRDAFVTHRSLTRASLIIDKRGELPDAVITHMLSGTIGAPAAANIMTFATMADELPSRHEIVSNPKTAPVPESPAALVLLVCNAVNWVEKDTINGWMQYMDRIPKAEAKALFAMQISAREDKMEWLSKVGAFTRFAMDKMHLFGG